MSDLSFEEVAEILGLLQTIKGADVELDWGELHLQVCRGGIASGNGLDQSPAPVTPEQQAAVAPVALATSDGSSPEQAHDPAPATQPDGATDEGPGGDSLVRAPMVGIFYRSPKPGEPPYVEVGDSVAAGDVVALIEVMKLFTELTAAVAGRVTGIEAVDATLVEFDQPLLRIEPA